MLHNPSFEISREHGDTANILGDKEACSRFDEIDGVAVGSVFDRIVLVLTQELESVVELKMMIENLGDLEVIIANRKGDSWATLRTRGVSGVELDL
jgi:hypothetical protein